MAANVQKLVILHTNDIHSHFEQMPKVAAAIAEMKRRHSAGEVLTIDCGDHIDRMRLETEGSEGLANISIMNATGYDAAVLGNNEGLTLPPGVLARLYGTHAEFTVIGSNMFEAATGKIPSWMAPCHIAQVGGLRIGLIGVTAPFTDFYKLLGWDVRDPFRTVAELVSKLRAQAQLVVVVSHLGLTQDVRLAEEVDGIDCIIGGHTHHLLENPLRVRNTHICAAGKFGRHVGEVTMHYDADARKLVHFSGRCEEVSSYPDDPDIVRLAAQYKESGKDKLGRVVASLDAPLSIDWKTESPLGNLLASGLRKWTGAEIGIVNAGQILDGLEAGRVTQGRLHEICPSPVNPCRMRLLGEHLWRALEESLLDDFVLKPIRGFGFRGEVLGTLCLDGMTVEYDASRPPYNKITGAWVGGIPFDKRREYSVGTIDMFTFGVGYLSLREGSDVQYFLPEFLRDVLGEQLRDAEAVRRCRGSRRSKS